MSHVILRPLCLADLDRVHRWHSSRALFRTLGRPFRPVTRATVRRWLIERLDAWPHEANLAICLINARRHVGNIYIRDIDWATGEGELHLFIGSARDRCHGVGTAATRLLCRHALERWRLQRLHLRVFASNHAAIRVYQKCGFVVERSRSRQSGKGGRAAGVVRMSLVRRSTSSETGRRCPPRRLFTRLAGTNLAPPTWSRVRPDRRKSLRGSASHGASDAPAIAAATGR
jgi:RimJ/RimL family protein N-acetyltransferase